MCLGVTKNAVPQIITKPIIVYKICKLNENKEVCSLFYNFIYKHGKLLTCDNAFEEATDFGEQLFSDFMEQHSVETHFGLSITSEIIDILVARKDLRFIKTGFHFYINAKRIAQKSVFDNEIIFPFEIPAGAKVMFGIDHEVGITNMIKLL